MRRPTSGSHWYWTRTDRLGDPRQAGTSTMYTRPKASFGRVPYPSEDRVGTRESRTTDRMRMMVPENLARTLREQRREVDPLSAYATGLRERYAEPGTDVYHSATRRMAVLCSLCAVLTWAYAGTRRGISQSESSSFLLITAGTASYCPTHCAGSGTERGASVTCYPG
eukprot:747653-Rhodomonas_salina.2